MWECEKVLRKEDAMEWRHGGSGAAAATRKVCLNVTDLEVRIRDTMRYHDGLINVMARQFFLVYCNNLLM